MKITEQKYLGMIDLPEDEEYLSYVKGILDNPQIQSMKNYVQHGDTSCLQHSVNVSYMTYAYCKKKGLDAKAAARAGLLHDMFLYDWHSHSRVRFHGFTHPSLALKNAEAAFALSKKEKNMILRHMWPLTVIPPQSREGFAIVWFDKKAALQESPKVPFLRPALGR